MSDTLDLPFALTPAQRKRLFGQYAKQGHAAPPGTGPEGETCGTCQHLRKVGGGNHSFFKCELRRATWTHGPKTDIRAKDPACRLWEREARG